MKVIFSIAIAIISTVTAMSSSAASIHSLRNGYSHFALSFDIKPKQVNVAASEESKEIAVAFFEKEAGKAKDKTDEPKTEVKADTPKTEAIVEQPKTEVVVTKDIVPETIEIVDAIETVKIAELNDIDISGEAASVTEPGSIGLMMLGAALFLGFRKSKHSV